MDRQALPGVDCVFDLDSAGRLPFEDDSVELVVGIHVLEHLRDPLHLMEELHRVAVSGAQAIFQVPHGSSDMAFEDPTHVRQMFTTSWGYFGQPFYWRADYGYRGDWKLLEVELHLTEHSGAGSVADAQRELATLRNTVDHMTATLECVKPARQPLLELQEHYAVTFLRGAASQRLAVIDQRVAAA